MNENHKHHHTCKYSREHKHQNKQTTRRNRVAYWITGLGSILWLALRTGTKPSRITYPCQQTAVLTSVGFLGYLASITGIAYLYRRASNKLALIVLGLLAMVVSLTIFVSNNGPYAYAKITSLPAWTSNTAISTVFAVENVPIPPCSLSGGTLPSTGACASPDYALSDDGVDALVAEMENRGDYFYKTAVYPTGIIAANDVVVIKINNQWANNGSNRRLSTNTDTLKGTIWRILQHPDSFTGEIIIAENTQDVVGSWDITPANSEDQNQSFQDVVDVFQGLGYPVYLYRLDDLNSNLTSGGDVSAGGYPVGEYANGNNDDMYIMLEDTADTGTNELSYPKFQTHTGGAFVSMRYGIWDGSSYDLDRLTFINMPVLKQHSMAGATIGWKNLIGLVTIADTDNRYGSWNEMHNFYWGYYSWNYDHDTYGLLGRHFAFIGTPDLNIVDAIWAADSNHNGTGVRQDILLASRDIFAVDWYASEYVLYPIWGTQNASAARSGTFRNATRINQNSAAANWSGTYPYMDLLDGYDGSTPSPDEQNQMNAYVVDAGQQTAVYDLTAHIAGTGTVNLTPPDADCTADCTESYDEGTVVTLTAVFPITSTFTGWSGAINTTTNPITLTMDTAKELTATFALNSYDLSVSIAGDGDGFVNINPPNVDCTADCTESYDEGTVVTLTAVFPITSTFTGWSGAMNTVTNPTALTIDEAKAIVATFSQSTDYIFLPMIMK